MPITRITRFTADPANTDELLARRAELITTVRASFPGLGDTRLARLDDETWVDVWRWDSAASAQAAADARLPEAASAFALVADVTAEEGEIVDER